MCAPQTSIFTIAWHNPERIDCRKRARRPHARVLIAQISDLHITPPGTFAYGCVDTAAALTAAIDTLNRFSPRPDLVVISGDIAHAALPEEYQHATKLLRALQIPFAAISKSRPPVSHSRGLPDPAYGAADSALNSMRRVGELDILLIDSTVPDAVHGELDTATLGWIEKTLAASSTRPALLFLHHPPFDTGIVSSDEMRLMNADALAALLKRHPRAVGGRGPCPPRRPNRVRGHLCNHLPGRRTVGHA